MIRAQFTVFVVAILLVITFYMITSSNRQTDCSECFEKAAIYADGSVKAGHIFVPDVPSGQPVIKPVPTKVRAKAAIVILCRNSDIEGLNKTIPMVQFIPTICTILTFGVV